VNRRKRTEENRILGIEWNRIKRTERMVVGIFISTTVLYMNTY